MVREDQKHAGKRCAEIGKTTALSATALSSILEALQEASVTPSENLETCYQPYSLPKLLIFM